MKRHQKRSARGNRQSTSAYRRLFFEQCEDRLLLSAVPVHVQQLAALQNQQASTERFATVQAVPVTSATGSGSPIPLGEGGFAFEGGNWLLDSSSQSPLVPASTGANGVSAVPRQNSSPQMNVGTPGHATSVPPVTQQHSTLVRTFGPEELPENPQQVPRDRQVRSERLVVLEPPQTAARGGGGFANVALLQRINPPVSPATELPEGELLGQASKPATNQSLPSAASTDEREQARFVWELHVDAAQPVAVALEIGESSQQQKNPTDTTTSAYLPPISPDNPFDGRASDESLEIDEQSASDDIPAEDLTQDHDQTPDNVASERRHYLAAVSVTFVATGSLLARSHWQQLQPRRPE